MFEHVSVLFEEVINGLSIKPNGIYVDGTLGGGGHALGILSHEETTRLIGVDQDMIAIEATKKRLSNFEDRVEIIHANYIELPNILKVKQPTGVDGILLDIGVSSPQIDQADRGFSYMHDAPLDMRMNQNQVKNAADIINFESEDALFNMISTYGEEKWAKRIASMIIEHRMKSPITRTLQLVDIIERAIPKGAREKGSHVAKRTFQALRIATNDELDVLSNVIEGLVDCLKPGGRLAIISFHSLEDRIVKEQYRYLASKCICPPKQPICTCKKTPKIKIVTRKPVVASSDELLNNKRAASAKLRIAEKID